jgi:hypothetical protein
MSGKVYELPNMGLANRQSRPIVSHQLSESPQGNGMK